MVALLSIVEVAILVDPISRQFSFERFRDLATTQPEASPFLNRYAG